MHTPTQARGEHRKVFFSTAKLKSCHFSPYCLNTWRFRHRRTWTTWPLKFLMEPCSLLYSFKFVLFWIMNERVGNQKIKCFASFHFLCAFPGRSAFPSSAAFRILANNKMLNKSMNLAPSSYRVSCISKAASANSGKNCENHYFA